MRPENRLIALRTLGPAWHAQIVRELRCEVVQNAPGWRQYCREAAQSDALARQIDDLAACVLAEPPRTIADLVTIAEVARIRLNSGALTPVIPGLDDEPALFVLCNAVLSQFTGFTDRDRGLAWLPS